MGVQRSGEGMRQHADGRFEYLSRPILNTPTSVRGTGLNKRPPGLLHFIPLVARTETIIAEVDRMISEDGRTWEDTLLVWEPDIVSQVTSWRGFVGDLLRHWDTLKLNSAGLPARVPRPHSQDRAPHAYLQVSPSITPVDRDLARNRSTRLTPSPNHREALTLLSLTPTTRLPAEEYKDLLALACIRLAQLRPRLGAVLRCGHLGCCYVDTTSQSGSSREADFGPEDVRWVPAFWDASLPGSGDKVVDPTGAGNAFVGGLGAALLEGHGIHEGQSFPERLADERETDGQPCFGAASRLRSSLSRVVCRVSAETRPPWRGGTGMCLPAG